MADPEPKLKRLVIKPIVVPRRYDGNDLYFYVLFTVHRCAEDAVGNPIPFCMRKNKNWPKWILNCMAGKNDGYRPYFVLHQEMRASGADPATLVYDSKAIKVLTPADMGIAGHSLDDPKIVNEMCELWEHVLSKTSDNNSDNPQTLESHILKAAFATNGTTSISTTRSLVEAYRASTAKIIANPNSASDLRPGRRLESLDQRIVAEAFFSADRQAVDVDRSELEPGLPLPGAELATGQKVSDPTGVYLILQLGYAAPNILQEFVTYQRQTNGERGREIANFIEHIWMTYGRASALGAAGEVVTSDRDPRFNELIRSRMAGNPTFAAAVGNIEKAYHEFILRRGQSEVRRLGRFIEGSRHRTVDTPAQNVAIASNGNAAMLVSYAPGKDKAPEVERKPFHEMMGQLRQHPGLMRRVAVALYCKVPADGFDKNLSEHVPAKFKDLIPDSKHPLFGSASLLILTNQDSPDDADLADSGRTFVPLQTACSVGSTPSNQRYFRARPQYEKSFFGPATDEDLHETKAADLWRTTHILPTALYTVSQDDISIAAARAHNELNYERTKSDESSMTKTQSVNIYTNPIDRQGNPVSLAAALDERLSENSQAEEKLAANTAQWFIALANWNSPFRLVSNGRAEPALPLIGYLPDLYAEQIMQGFAVYVQRVKHESLHGDKWRSLCRRMVDIDPDDSNDVCPKQNSLKRLWTFEEEGCISTSVSTAPRPFVGICTQTLTVEEGVKFELQVINADNKKAKLFRWVPYSKSAQDGVSFGGIFRKRVTRGDLKLHDFLLVTPHGREERPGSSSDPNCHLYSEVLIFPVFNNDRFTIPRNQGELWLAVSSNKIEFAGTHEPRGKELFPIMLNRFSTRYLDEVGSEIGLTNSGTPEVKQFTVEGDRRYYAIPWALAPQSTGENVAGDSPPAGNDTTGDTSGQQSGNRRTAFKQVEPLVITPKVDPETPSSAAKEKLLRETAGVFNSLGSTNVVSPWHLRPSDSCSLVTLPKAPTESKNTESQNLESFEGFDSIDLPNELVATYIWNDARSVDAPTSSSGVSSESTDDNAATQPSMTPSAQRNARGSPTKNGTANQGSNGELKPVDARFRSALQSDSSELLLVRGFVARIECEISFRARFDSGKWSFAGGTPTTYFKNNSPRPLSISLDDLLKSAQSQVPPQSVFEIPVRIRGAFRRDGGNFVPVNIESLSVEAPFGEGSRLEASKIDWRFTVQAPQSSTTSEVFFEELGNTWPRQLRPIDENRFLHPLEIQEKLLPQTKTQTLVEFIGTSGKKGLNSRWWPQHCLGSYIAAKDSTDLPRFCFSDGTAVDLERTSSVNDPTDRYEVTRSENQPAKIKSLESTPNERLLVCGTVTSHLPIPPANDSEDRKALLRIELTDLHDKVWIIEHVVDDDNPEMIQPSHKSLPPRRLTELELGEFLSAECDLNVGPGAAVAVRSVKIRKQKDSNYLLSASVSLFGLVEKKPGLLTSPGQTGEGTDRYRLTAMKTIQGALSGRRDSTTDGRIEFWAHSTALEDLVVRTLFTCPALRVIHAQTLAKYSAPAKPTKNEKEAIAEPTHSMTSELIARWSGWSLTSPVPGKTDGSEVPPDQTESLRIQVRRPNLACGVDDQLKERFLLPPMRFDNYYNFCLRRVDLAGNHDYDEEIRIDDKKLAQELQFAQGQYRNEIVALYDQTHLQQARKRANSKDGSIGKPPVQKITPAHTPLPPMLAFLEGRFIPAYQPTRSEQPGAALARSHRGERTNGELIPISMGLQSWQDIHQHYHSNTPCWCHCPPKPPLKPPDNPFVDIDFKLQFVVYEREQALFLLTDVLDPSKSVRCDADGWLLPPPTPVELALMSGELDKNKDKKKKPAAEVVAMIRAHERYLDDRCSYMGADAFRSLNYFGDSQAKQVFLGLASDDCEVQPESTCLRSSPTLFFGDHWPQVREIHLSLVTCQRPDMLRAQGPPVELTSDAIKSGKTLTDVEIPLPPGTEGFLLLHRECDKSIEWDKIRLIHATNGAWKRPAWKRLAETLPAANQVPSSSRSLEGQIELDVPSSGTYTIHAYWNDPRDASVARNFRKGRGLARIDRNCCGIDGAGAGVVSVDVVDAGHGLGHDAVAIIAMPRSEPIFKVVLQNKKVKAVEILDPGDGCRFDFPLRIDPADVLESGHKSACAIAVVNRAGQVEQVKVREAGDGFAGKPIVRVAWPKAPFLEPVCRNGTVERVVIHQAGSGFVEDFEVEFIRRPPLVRIAEAHATLNNQGGIESVQVTDRGGWYAVPPIVVAMDIGGSGHGALLSAQLDQAGGVGHIAVLAPGSHYSSDLHIGIYTQQFQTVEQGIPRAEVGERQDRCEIAFRHPLGDLRGRRVDYVVELGSRFQPYLDEAVNRQNEIPPPCRSTIWNHVPRYSPPFQVELQSYLKPAKPDVEELLPAFEWKVRSPGGIPLEAADEYFKTNNSGRIIVEGTPSIRVYLRRPWHQSGIERLGIVVAPAILNTVRIPTNETETLEPSSKGKDEGEFNPIEKVGDEQAYNQEPLAAYVIPAEMRPFVSRWGFDPVYNQEKFGPLTADNFESRADGVIYDQIELGEMSPSSPLPPPLAVKPVWLALHDVHYDGAREQWYSDLKLSLRDPNRQKCGLPMVELALVAHQAEGEIGNRISPVLRADFYKVLGERTLDVERRNRRKFIIKLSGHFDFVNGKSNFPRRQLFASVRFRDRTLPTEVIGFWPPAKAKSPSVDAGWANRPNDHWSQEPETVATLQPVALEWSKRGKFYWGTIVLDESTLAAVGNNNERGLALSIDEYEAFAAAEGSLSFGQDGMVVIDGQTCANRLIWSYTLEIA